MYDSIKCINYFMLYFWHMINKLNYLTTLRDKIRYQVMRPDLNVAKHSSNYIGAWVVQISYLYHLYDAFKIASPNLVPNQMRNLVGNETKRYWTLTVSHARRKLTFVGKVAWLVQICFAYGNFGYWIFCCRLLIVARIWKKWEIRGTRWFVIGKVLYMVRRSWLKHLNYWVKQHAFICTW